MQLIDEALRKKYRLAVVADDAQCQGCQEEIPFGQLAAVDLEAPSFGHKLCLDCFEEQIKPQGQPGAIKVAALFELGISDPAVAWLSAREYLRPLRRIHSPDGETMRLVLVFADEFEDADAFELEMEQAGCAVPWELVLACASIDGEKPYRDVLFPAVLDALEFNSYASIAECRKEIEARYPLLCAAFSEMLPRARGPVNLRCPNCGGVQQFYVEATIELRVLHGSILPVAEEDINTIHLDNEPGSRLVTCREPGCAYAANGDWFQKLTGVNDA